MKVDVSCSFSRARSVIIDAIFWTDLGCVERFEVGVLHICWWCMLPFSTLTWPLFILSSRIIYTDNRLNRTGNLQTYFSRSVDMSCCTCRLYMNVIELCWEHFVFPHFMSDDLCQLQRMSIWERLKWSFLFLFLFSFSFFLLCWWSIVRCNKEKTNQNLNIQFLTTFVLIMTIRIFDQIETTKFLCLWETNIWRGCV